MRPVNAAPAAAAAAGGRASHLRNQAGGLPLPGWLGSPSAVPPPRCRIAPATVESDAGDLAREERMREGAIRGLAGVLIWTEAGRFEEMARFYRDRLGLTPRTSKPDFISFDWGGVRLSVSVHDGVRGPSRDPSGSW